MFGILKGKKTYVTGVSAIFGLITAYLLGEMSLADTLQGSLTAVLGMTVRHGVSSEAAKKLVLGFLCVGMLFAFQPRQANADPLFGFLASSLVGAWGITVHKKCEAEGSDFKTCVKKLLDERKSVPITQKIYRESFNG